MREGTGIGSCPRGVREQKTMAGSTVSTRVAAVPVWAQRVARQLVQTYGPVILVVLSAPRVSNDLGAVFTAVLTVVVFTTIKLAVKLKAGPDAPWYMVVLDRSGSAAASVIAGTGVTSLFGLMTIDWAEVGGAAVLAGFTALLMLFYVPPVEPDPVPGMGESVPKGQEDGTLEGTSPQLYDEAPDPAPPGRGVLGQSTRRPDDDFYGRDSDRI